MKKLFTLSLLLLCCQLAQAQFLKERVDNTRVQLELSNYTSPNTNNLPRFESFVNAIGVSMEHKLYKNIAIKAGYHFQENFLNAPVYPSRFFNAGMSIMTRLTSHLVDIGATYKYSIQRHQLYAGVGANASFGTETRRVGGPTFEWNCEPQTKEVTTRYYGVVWEAGYNYLTANRRFNFGPSVSGRNYPGTFSMYCVKLNFGYNFEL